MKHIYLYILAVASAFTLFSCASKSEVGQQLERAESLLARNPDSALVIIGSIPINEIRGAGEKSEFILLYERILEKNGINFIGEEDMEEAVSYFSEGKEPLKLFLAHLYMGKIYDAAGNQYQAMEQYVEAEGVCGELEEEVKALYTDEIASLHMAKGDLFFSKLNINSARKAYEKGCGFYERSGDSLKLMRCYGKLAKCHEQSDKYEEALDAYNKALDLAGTVGEKRDILSYSTAISGIDFAMGASSQSVLEELQSIYGKYNGGTAPADNYILLSCLHLDNGNVGKAREYALKFKAESQSMRDVESAALSMLLSTIAKADGNYAEALQHREDYDTIMASVNEQERENSIREIEQLYYNKQLVVENENMKRQNRNVMVIYSLLVVILVLVLMWLVLLWRRKIKMKNSQIEHYLVVAQEAENSKNSLLGELDVQKEKEKRLKELLESRFREIRELAGTYYEFGYSKKLHRKVEQILSFQSFGQDMFEVIENVVNAKNNGAIEKIRRLYPQIPEENIKLLNLIYAGFSPQEISVIINDSPQNIYVRKSRLKRKLADLIDEDPTLEFK